MGWWIRINDISRVRYLGMVAKGEGELLRRVRFWGKAGLGCKIQGLPDTQR